MRLDQVTADRRRAHPLLVFGAIASGLLPVAFAVLVHAASYPVALTRVAAVTLVAGLYSAAIYAVARRLGGSAPVGAKAALIWSLAIFVYPNWFSMVPALRHWPEPPIAVAYLAIAASLCAVTLARRRTGGDLPGAISMGVVVVLALMIVVTGPQYRRIPFRLPLTPLPDGVHADATSARPNIYHLVLDGMGRPDVLARRYGVDLTPAVSSLTAAGFVVERGASANYAQTYLSIPSMLNADYLHVPADRIDETSRVPLHEAMEHNVVFSALRRAGYDVTFLASDYSATEDNVQATACRCDPILFGEFEANIAYSTPFRAMWPGDFDYVPHRNRVEGTLDAFAASGGGHGSRPRYTFAHVLSPHPPFIFKADGTFAPPARAFTIFDASLFPGDAAEYRNGYANQATYVMRRAAAIASALAAADPTAIVIVSGDHGPRLDFSAMDARRTDANEVLPIFLAVRWGTSTADAPHVESLVNLYRAVLNRALGMSLAPLTPRSYISSFSRPYRLLQARPCIERACTP